ncbi:hypothetical protein M011DRAFT_462320 [Sporormia fimetaria CBS 119925]|uniref:Uncharacterized protein n=1 Tax=Sporormia fimetaria CBS 119925 TaxID=1340428 RepID=A0A6A6V000_9PLEO|nr:hypothetical protein M011DRAFT_462320 [Sporormia fimetaria CBS 119925]
MDVSTQFTWKKRCDPQVVSFHLLHSTDSPYLDVLEGSYITVRGHYRTIWVATSSAQCQRDQTLIEHIFLHTEDPEQTYGYTRPPKCNRETSMEVVAFQVFCDDSPNPINPPNLSTSTNQTHHPYRTPLTIHPWPENERVHRARMTANIGSRYDVRSTYPDSHIVSRLAAVPPPLPPSLMTRRWDPQTGEMYYGTQEKRFGEWVPGRSKVWDLLKVVWCLSILGVLGWMAREGGVGGWVFVVCWFACFRKGLSFEGGTVRIEYRNEGGTLGDLWGRFLPL